MDDRTDAKVTNDLLLAIYRELVWQRNYAIARDRLIAQGCAADFEKMIASTNLHIDECER